MPLPPALLPPPQVLAVCGLAFEAAIACGAGVVPVCAPGPEAVADRLEALLGTGGAARAAGLSDRLSDRLSDPGADRGARARIGQGDGRPGATHGASDGRGRGHPREAAFQAAFDAPSDAPSNAAFDAARDGGGDTPAGGRATRSDGRDGNAGAAPRPRAVPGAMEGAARAPWSGILSFGCAGGLDPGLLPGDCVVASAVWTPDGLLPTDPAWTQALLARLPRARLAPLAGVDAPLVSPAAKAALYRATGAGIADMESHAAARAARRHGLPFVACRIVLDPAWRALPACALAALRADGSTAPWPLLRRLAADPRQLMALCALGDDAWLARRILRDVRRRLGTALAWPGRTRPMPRP